MVNYSDNATRSATTPNRKNVLVYVSETTTASVAILLSKKFEQKNSAGVKLTMLVAVMKLSSFKALKNGLRPKRRDVFRRL